LRSTPTDCGIAGLIKPRESEFMRGGGPEPATTQAARIPKSGNEMRRYDAESMPGSKGKLRHRQ
jgi:hypothetical protein